MSELIFDIEELRKIIEMIEVEALRIGFMYVFTVAADVSEVWGHCTPSKKDVMRIIYDGEEEEKIPAIVFKIKDVRSKNKFRIVAIPENSKYDPWAKIIYDWMQKQKKEHPFHYKEGNKAIRTYTSEPIKLAKKIFKDFKGYTKLYYRKNEKVEPKDTNFTLTSLRDVRRDQLRDVYRFSNVDLAIFTGRLQYVRYDPYDREQYETTFKLITEDITKEKIIEVTNDYFTKLLIPNDTLYIASDPVSLHIRNWTELDQRFKLASDVSTLIRNINIVSEIKLGTTLFKENMELTLQIIKPCKDKDDFTVKIANLAALFEIDKSQLENMVNESNNKGTIKLMHDLLIQNDIAFTDSLFTTWYMIRDFRNMYPIHSKVDPIKLAELLMYFDEPIKMPPNYPRLWDSIMIKFINSLQELLTIINENQFKK